MAYNVEGSVAFLENWVAGLKVEGSEHLYAWDEEASATAAYHETGLGAVVSYDFHDNAVVGIEYMRLMNKDADDTDLVTVQLALKI